MSYQVHLTQFEGPLDLLLHLIEKEELDITQVALAQVTDEFVRYVESMRGHIEISVVADFLVVASRLLWIKSRALLPQSPRSAAEDTLEDTVGDELLQQLRTYRKYKEAAQWLRERDETGIRAYVRIAPLPRPQRITLELAGVTMATLRTAAQAALYPREGPRPQEAIPRPRISIVQQIRLIRLRLMQWKQVAFLTLLGRTPTRLEAVVTLQATLELIKQQAVLATQGELFGEILIEPLMPPEQIPESVSPPEIIPEQLLPHQSANR
jgi:segregation and condensation protein A